VLGFARSNCGLANVDWPFVVASAFNLIRSPKPCRDQHDEGDVFRATVWLDRTTSDRLHPDSYTTRFQDTRRREIANQRLSAASQTLHNFVHNPRLWQLTSGIIGDFFHPVW
jgi:hypothetical protein